MAGQRVQRGDQAVGPIRQLRVEQAQTRHCLQNRIACTQHNRFKFTGANQSENGQR
jgi:hypothetical protein